MDGDTWAHPDHANLDIAMEHAPALLGGMRIAATMISPRWLVGKPLGLGAVV
jgi:hypothetical protein